MEFVEKDIERIMIHNTSEMDSSTETTDMTMAELMKNVKDGYKLLLDKIERLEDTIKTIKKTINEHDNKYEPPN